MERERTNRYEMKKEMAVTARKASYSFRNKKAEVGKKRASFFTTL